LKKDSHHHVVSAATISSKDWLMYPLAIRRSREQRERGEQGSRGAEEQIPLSLSPGLSLGPVL